jgi:hypothetical protein
MQNELQLGVILLWQGKNTEKSKIRSRSGMNFNESRERESEILTKKYKVIEI